MSYYIGLDNGGTTTKAAIFDDKGNEIGVSSVSTDAIIPKPGFTERDMDEMWRANCTVIRGVLEKSGVSPEDIAAIAVCGHGKGLYLWGKDNKPAMNGIISTDNRAYAYEIKWKTDGTEAKAAEYSVQSVMACQPVALLAWLKDNMREVYDNIAWVFGCKDYVRFKLTGEALAEYTDNSGSNLMNLYTRKFDKRLLELFGIPEVEHALPPLRKATEICGHVTEEAAKACGLKAGTPVAGGMFDIDACALALDVLNDERICMIAGTWSINEYPSRNLVKSGGIMNSLFAIPDLYLIEQCSATSAGNNEWFVNTMLKELSQQASAEGRKVYDIVNQWVESVPPEEFCPVFLPFLFASNVHPNARGSFVGLAGNHDRKHLCRSVYEGVAFSHKYHLNKLLKTRTNAPECIRLAGGVVNSPVWVQMFADIMEMPVETVNVKETGALGCAIAAAVAVGNYPSIDEAAKAMCHIGRRVEPNEKNYDIYRRKYDLYLKTIDALDGLWSDMQSFIEYDPGK